ncbi:MAG: 5-nucleotidase, C-terminal domain [Capsulimonas sp.]|nr:5-nucleotidase, C-terminal domain [Capsulimonas sp.]
MKNNPFRKTVILSLVGLGLTAAFAAAARSAYARNEARGDAARQGASGESNLAASKDTIHIAQPLVGEGSSEHETNLGNLIADSIRAASNAEVAILPADEISETTIPAGDIKPGDLAKALRYANDPSDTIVVLDLTGSQILQAAERSVSHLPQPFPGFLQVSGLQVRYDPAQPVGKRVKLAGADSSEISATKHYKVATTRTLAGGGLGYFKVWKKSDADDETNISVTKALATYLAGHKVLTIAVEGRVAPLK